MKRILGLLALAAVSFSANAGTVTVINTTSVSVGIPDTEIWMGSGSIARLTLTGTVPPGTFTYPSTNAFLAAMGVSGTTYAVNSFINGVVLMPLSCTGHAVGTLTPMQAYCGITYYATYTVSGPMNNVVINIY